MSDRPQRSARIATSALFAPSRYRVLKVTVVDPQSVRAFADKCSTQCEGLWVAVRSAQGGGPALVGLSLRGDPPSRAGQLDPGVQWDAAWACAQRYLAE